MHRPPWQIDLPEEEEIYCCDLLEELDIAYNTLYHRIQRNDFPRPCRAATGHLEAKWKVKEVKDWLLKHDFQIRGYEKRWVRAPG
jgi:predicted DNA-binding transcriptional regulator AlpA